MKTQVMTFEALTRAIGELNIIPKVVPLSGACIGLVGEIQRVDKYRITRDGPERGGTVTLVFDKGSSNEAAVTYSFSEQCLALWEGTHDENQGWAPSQVDHPSHYGGKDNPYEAIKVIEAWDLNFRLGNTVKYISRAGKKDANIVTDLKKAAWYLQREIESLEAAERTSASQL